MKERNWFTWVMLEMLMVRHRVHESPFCVRPVRHRTLHKILSYRWPIRICVSELFARYLQRRKWIWKLNINWFSDRRIFGGWDLPSLPTTKLMSDINSLLNIAALRSRTVGFVACQFGSPVSMANKLFGNWNDADAFWAPGDANGDDGALHGCVTWVVSRCIWALLCGGDSSKWPLFNDSTANWRKEKHM